MVENGSIAVTMTEAAKMLSVSVPTIYRWAGFPAVRIGGCSRVLVADLREWLHHYGKEG